MYEYGLPEPKRLEAEAAAPSSWQQLVADPALVVPAGEEMVRFDASLQIFERTATRPVEVYGTVVGEGQKIAALLGAANRDPAVFADPDRLDVTRSPNPHLGFGARIRFCLGAPLARVEVQAVLGALRRRLPGLVLAAEPERRPEFSSAGCGRSRWPPSPSRGPRRPLL